MSFAADFPDNYANLSAKDRDNRSLVTSDQCIIDETEFYIRGCIEIPIQGSDDIFLWGLWANVWPEDFDEIQESWEEEGREMRRGPYRGRLGNKLSAYSVTTANLKLTIRIQPIGQRPLFEVEEPEHPLAIQQREGISKSQVQDLVERILHPSDRLIQ